MEDEGSALLAAGPLDTLGAEVPDDTTVPELLLAEEVSVPGLVHADAHRMTPARQDAEVLMGISPDGDQRAGCATGR